MSRVRASSRSGGMAPWARFAVVGLVCLVMLLPLYCMVVVAFTPRGALFDDGAKLWPSSFTLQNLTRLFTRFPMGTWMLNSVMVASITTALSVTVNLLAGYALAKIRFRGRQLMFVAVLSTLMIPAQAIMLPQFRTVVELGLFGTFWAVILPSAATALGIFLARQFLLAIPDELLEAARIDGAGQLRTFRSVVLPLCRPLIAVMVLIAFMGQWNDFLWPLITLKDPQLYTLPVSLRFLQGQYESNYSEQMAAALVMSVPLVLMFILLQRFFVQGLARTGIK